jgi:hypothetical protein
VGLVYITAFAPDKGESVSSLIKDPPPGAPVPPILPRRPKGPARRPRLLRNAENFLVGPGQTPVHDGLKYRH